MALKKVPLRDSARLLTQKCNMQYPPIQCVCFLTCYWGQRQYDTIDAVHYTAISISLQLRVRVSVRHLYEYILHKLAQVL